MGINVFVVGSGAQARICHAMRVWDHDWKYIFDQDRNIETCPFPGCLLLHEEVDFELCAKRCDGFQVCVAGVERGPARVGFGRRLEALNIAPLYTIHDSAILPPMDIPAGIQIMAGAVIGFFPQIGDYCIIGQNASIDHDCKLGHGVNVMGGAAVAGRVTIGDYVSIGTNATILPDLSIGEGAIIGAGAVVTKDVPPYEVWVGVPAQWLRMRKTTGVDLRND